MVGLEEILAGRRACASRMHALFTVAGSQARLMAVLIIVTILSAMTAVGIRAHHMVVLPAPRKAVAPHVSGFVAMPTDELRTGIALLPARLRGALPLLFGRGSSRRSRSRSGSGL